MSGLSITFVLGAWLALGCSTEESASRPRTVARGAGTQPAPVLAFFRASSRTRLRYDLAVFNPKSRRLRLLVGDSVRRSVRPQLFARPAWSPNGRLLAFAREFGERAGDKTDIYVMRADGSRLRRLTTRRDAFDPVWRPDGKRIIFSRRGRSLFEASLWSMRPDGSGRRRLTRSVRGRVDAPGSFAPDGSLLSFTRQIHKTDPAELGAVSSSSIFVMNPDGSEQRELTDRGADPAFSPDGERIAFVSDRDKNGELSYGDVTSLAAELYVMSADGSESRRLTHTRNLNEARPSWLTEGSRIAYQRGKVTDNAEGTVIMQINPDGSCPRPVLRDPRLITWYASPAWRPGKAQLGGGRLRC